MTTADQYQTEADKLRAKAKAAEAKAAEAKAAAEAAAEAEAERRHQARQKLRRQRLHDYDSAAHDAEIADAHAKFTDAVLGDANVYAAYLDWCTAQARHYVAARDASTAWSELSSDTAQAQPTGPPPPSGPGTADGPDFGEAVGQVLSAEVQRRIADMLDQSQAELDEAGA